MSHLPTGTVTFLFTDVEGSTKLWERCPEGMQASLVRHDEILRDAIESRCGYVFKTVGDAFYAAFPTALSALEAALAAQRALCTEDWSEDITALRVRMAMHTGAADERGGDYFGPPVNRVARLLSAGHGGQILLSLPAQELVRDQLPDQVALWHLGEWRLKDLTRPEHIFQLVAPDLSAEFPPLRTLERHPNNLPHQSTPLVGRKREVDEILERLLSPEVRLITLTGPGGTGKTRLGLQVAAELLDEFKDGAFFVPLAAITDPDLVTSSLAQTLGVREAGDQSVIEALKDYLCDRELLLLLDNFEQVLEAAPMVTELLRAPRLKVLATSRTILRLYGESEYAVRPLELPDLGRLPDLERLTQYEGVRLFIERAKAAKADFAITNDNAPAVAEICARLDGLPLAIELAAARIKLLSPRAMLDRLSNRLKLLTGGARDLPVRQRTLRSAIEWSYALLEEGERMLFARLAIFAGSCSLEAIEAICDAKGDLPVDALEGVSSLLNKSLLRQEEGPEGEPRFAMLETIREYALERQEESGEALELERRHAGFFLEVAEEAEPHLRGPDQTRWLERLADEHDNVRAAMRGLLEKGEPEKVARLGWALWLFWWIRGHFAEGRRWMEEALAKGSAMRPHVRAKALFVAGTMAIGQAEYRPAEPLIEESTELFREAHDERGTALAVGSAGIAAVNQKRFEEGIALLEEAGSLYRKLGCEWELTAVLASAAGAWLGLGNLDRAGRTAEESLELSRKLGDRTGISIALYVLATVRHASGDQDRAKELFGEGLALAAELGDEANVVYYLEELGAACASEGKPVRAARLWGAAEVLLEEIEATAYPHRSDGSLHQQQVAAARAHLDERSWKVAWSQGRAMTFDRAIAYALDNDHD